MARAWRREILEAIVQSSRVNAPAYGADDYTARAQARLDRGFRAPRRRLSRRHRHGRQRAGARRAGPSRGRPSSAMRRRISRRTNAARRSSSPRGENSSAFPALAGKIAPETLRETLARFPRGQVKTTQPGALSLSQASEAGTIYRPERNRRARRRSRTRRASPCIWTARASPTRSSRPASRRPR